jgi:glycosyltransferase involved in cell wall biosynthesis
MVSERWLRVAHFTLGRCRLDSANGVDKAVYHLARSQAALGHDVAVFSLTPKASIPIPGVRVSTCPPVRLGLPVFRKHEKGLRVIRSLMGVPKRLVKEIVEWQPDVLHLHSVHTPSNVVLARRLSSAVPYCVTIHGGLSPIALKRNWWAKRLFGVLVERDYLQRAAFLHAISEFDVHAIECYGATNPIVMAPNGIDLEPLPPVLDKSALLELDPNLNGKRIFLFLGRLDRQQKGLDILLRAFATSRPDNSALVLVGPDWRDSQRRLQELARSLNIADVVLFAGPAQGKRKVELLGSADVFVHPSRTEAGVPFAVLEAAAMARPCLVSTAVDPAGILARGGAAISVPPTVEGIAAGVRQMSTAPMDALREMGRRAREIAEREFSWSRTAGILIEAYRTHAVRRRK